MGDAPTRVNFFDGMLLTGEDLRAEQEYSRRMRYLHNRLHGHGVVEGLEVSADRHAQEVRVGAGWAIDRQGREIVLADVWSAALPDDRVVDLVIVWAEVAACPVPARPDDGLLHTRWVEAPSLSFAAPEAGAADGLVLARIRRGRLGKVSVDSSVRRPLSR